MEQTSLPTRERGLKWVLGSVRKRVRASLPTRERGLKYFPGSAPASTTGRSLHGSVD